MLGKANMQLVNRESVGYGE